MGKWKHETTLGSSGAFDTRLRRLGRKEQSPERAGISLGRGSCWGCCKHAVPGDSLRFRSGFKNSHSMNVSVFLQEIVVSGVCSEAGRELGVYLGLKA